MSAPPARPCSVIELRRYRLHPGRRDELVALFERELIAPQEALGMRVIGPFTDVDRPDDFVWLRGFADMASRDRGLRGFYFGPVWAEHRAAANATMVDSDDVLLLRPVWTASACDGAGAEVVLATTWLLPEQPAAAMVAAVRRDAASGVRAAGGHPLALMTTEPGANSFPELPVREGEHAVVLLTAFAGLDALDVGRRALGGRPLRDTLGADVAAHHARLMPTARSPRR
jgi:hypothetical protein